MLYATPQDMIDAFTRREMLSIADPEDIGEIDIDHVTKALVAASGNIDFALSQHHTLPLMNLTAQNAVKLKEVCVNIARHKLTGSGGVTVTEHVKSLFDSAEAWLDKVSLGKLRLTPAPGDGTNAGPGISAENTTAGEASFNPGARRIFGAGSFDDYFG